MPDAFRFLAGTVLGSSCLSNEDRGCEAITIQVVGSEPGVRSRGEIGAWPISRGSTTVSRDDKGGARPPIPLREQWWVTFGRRCWCCSELLAFVLLIAWRTWTNLVLAKLGAAQGDCYSTALVPTSAIVRQHFGGTVVLSVAGGALGLLLARLSIG